MENITRKKRILRKKRNRAKIFGTAERPRLSVFRSNRFTYAQLIDDNKGNTLAAASTKEQRAKSKEQNIKKTKTEQARALGEILAEKAKKLGIKKSIFNKGLYKYHGRVKAVAEGARKGGLSL